MNINLGNAICLFCYRRYKNDLWYKISKECFECFYKSITDSECTKCCCIAKNIANKGTPNHLLVNKVLEYHYNNFNHYTM
jgi:hypothetical protein